MSGSTGMLRDLNYTGLSAALDAHQADALSSRTAILRDAAKGDNMARFVANKILNLSGWWSREQGNIVGDMVPVVADLEARGIPRFSDQPSPLPRMAKRLGMRGGGRG